MEVDFMDIKGRHACKELAETDPLILCIDEKNRIVVRTDSVLYGSRLVWFKIFYCPFCGEELKDE